MLFNAIYTIRYLNIWVSLQSRKNIQTNPAMSSILSHINASGHPANFDDFQILSSCSDSYELMIHESLLINKYKPNLNVQGSSIPLNLF